MKKQTHHMNSGEQRTPRTPIRSYYSTSNTCNNNTDDDDDDESTPDQLQDEVNDKFDI